LTPTLAGSFAVALASLSTVASFFSFCAPHAALEARIAIPFSVTTIVANALVFAVILRYGRSRAAVFCVLAGITLGAVDVAPLAFFSGFESDLIPLLLVLGSLAGFGFGLCFAGLGRALARVTSYQALDTAERIVRETGGWLAWFAAVTTVVPLACDPPSPLLLVAGALVCLCGLLAYALGTRWARARAAWLARVRAGAEYGWAIAPYQIECSNLFWYVQPLGARHATNLLVRIPPHEKARPTPLALVP
jgi:hypothetical protein